MGCRLSGPWMSDGTMGVSAQDLRYIRNHEALRILATCEQPITVQIEGRRGRSLQYHRSSGSSTQTERQWDVTSNRPCYSHMSLPGNHGDGGRYEYLPNTPRDLEDRQTLPHHDPEFSPKAAQKQNCLLSCCNSNMEEPSSFQSQTEDEDYMLEKTVGYLPLHHELDSGLGWTDGSFHQGELSGVETEEGGLDECHAHQGGRGARVRGGSPSSESFISSELSDSGFYSVSTAEFLRFQRLLEKRMRVYNSRLHHQGENLCMDAQKAHRELEAIPEALAMQPDVECIETDAQPRQMVRVASVQLHKGERPCLNRHSSSSAAIFSTCSSPSGQQSAATPHGTTAAGMLRRSRTLHHRPAQVEQRRRASHPASPNYCSVTLNRYAHMLQQQLTEEAETNLLYNAKYRTHYVNQPVHHANHLTHHANHPLHHAKHMTHHANHHTHHASYPTHHAHLTNFTTLHANHSAPSVHHAKRPTHIANHVAHHANSLTHANLPSQPYNATLPAQHTHHAHGALTSHSPCHNHTHATLPTQHTHHINDTHASHGTHHGHAHITLTAHHTHHVHCTPTSHDVHHGHAHTSLPEQDSHHTHDTLTSHGMHRSHAHATLPVPAHDALPSPAPPCSQASFAAQHTHHAHHTLALHALPHTHATLPAQHAHHKPRTHPKHAISQPSLSSSADDHYFALPQESYLPEKRGRSFTEPPTEPSTSGKKECEKETSGEQERGRFHTLSHTPSQEGNDTWPKSTNRHGPYSTLGGHVTTATPSVNKPPSGVVNLRASRNQLLRERALQLADERSGGISTDDETNVEIRRVGRYWSRSERREQVLQKQRQKREALRGGVANSSMGGDSGGYNVLMELSQRKLSRLRNRKLLDDWTTVEELLTHGTRLGPHDENMQIPNSLLTVTTV